ncbi:MAG: hypothetical protein JRN35_05615 [Nitrososphaerota archaeon]|nr:hypothetical protein [Nitrososphaerota archaeon]
MAYRDLEDPHQGRVSDRCPLVIEGLKGSEVQLAGPRKSDRRILVRRVLWAVSLSELREQAEKLNHSRLLVIDQAPQEPTVKPLPPVVTLLLHPFQLARSSYTEMGPVAFARPDSVQAMQASTNSILRSSLKRWRNAAHAEVRCELIPPETDTLQSLNIAYMSLWRETKRQGLFLPSEFRDIYLRINAEMVPHAVLEPDSETIPTMQLIGYLERMYTGSSSPRNPLIIGFLDHAKRVITERARIPQAKGEWLRLHSSELLSDTSVGLVVGDAHNVRSWNLYRSRLDDERKKITAIPLGQPSAASDASDLIVTTSPGTRFLEDVVTGGARRTVFLLYPWELRRLEQFFASMEATMKNLGITGWPDLKSMSPHSTRPPELSLAVPMPEASGDSVLETLVGRAESEPETGLSLRDDGPRLKRFTFLLDDGTSDVLWEGQTVIARRRNSFEDTPVEKVTIGDLLVVPRGVSSFRAHRILERVCQLRPVYKENLRQATSWKKLLKEWVNERYAGRTITEVHHDAAPPCTYAAFRNWLQADEPIAPEPDNLRWLYSWLGFDRAFAERALYARRCHIRDRKAIYADLLKLNQGRLEELLAARERASNRTNVGNPSELITVEEMLELVSFKTVKEMRLDLEASNQVP